MLDIFVCKTLAARALCQSHAFAERSIIRFAVGCVERVHREATFDTDHEVVLLGIILWESGVKMGGFGAMCRFSATRNFARWRLDSSQRATLLYPSFFPRAMKSVGKVSTYALYSCMISPV